MHVQSPLLATEGNTPFLQGPVSRRFLWLILERLEVSQCHPGCTDGSLPVSILHEASAATFRAHGGNLPSITGTTPAAQNPCNSHAAPL